MSNLKNSWEITPNTTWLGTSIREYLSYKDLLTRMVRKEILTTYQQTLLGPVWVIIQPILTVLTYVLVFNKVIGISTEGIPAFFYYLIGITLWNLFSDLFLGTTYTFVQNIHIFSKVYFPRLIAPLSILLLQSFRLLIQLLLLFIVALYYQFTGPVDLVTPRLVMIVPVIITTAGIAFGLGLLFSVLTAKYKDLLNLLQMAIRLFMFICPIFFSLSMVPEKLKLLVSLNPLSSLFEMFRYAFLGTSHVPTAIFIYSIIFMVLSVTFGVMIFNKMADKLMDVI